MIRLPSRFNPATGRHEHAVLPKDSVRIEYSQTEVTVYQPGDVLPVDPPEEPPAPIKDNPRLVAIVQKMGITPDEYLELQGIIDPSKAFELVQGDDPATIEVEKSYFRRVWDAVTGK